MTPVFFTARCGDGRASHFAALAAALTTSIRRGSLRCLRRNATGSAPIADATSSMIDACANVFCRRSGERSGPVQKYDFRLCVSTRSPAMVPVPPRRPPTLPATYDGAMFKLLAYAVGSGAGVLGVNGCGSAPARNPVMTLPGLL